MQHDARHLAADFTSKIYAALLGTGSWQSFVDDLSRTLPNGKVTLFYHDLAARTGAFSLSANFDPATADAYSGYYAARNPWMAKATRRPLDLGVRAEAMLGRADLVRTEFYSDYLRPMGIITGAGVTMLRDHSCNFMLSTLGAQAEDAQLASVAALLGTLAPHLRQAFAYYRRAGGVASGLVALDAASDALGVAIVSIGLGRRVRWANAAGRRLLAAGDLIGTDASGRVTAASVELRDALEAALAAAVRGGGAAKRSMIVPAGEDGSVISRLTLVVPALTSCEQYFSGPSVVLLAETASAGSLGVEEALRGAFGLTAAEAQFACAIADGASLADVAAQRGITKETVRTHLKRIFAKMGVGRQAELVAKVHRYQRLRS